MMHPKIRITENAQDVIIQETTPAGTAQQQATSPTSSTITPDGTVTHPPIDGTDMMARLCSTERIKADDLPFWKKCMDGMEWAFYEQSVEVQALIQQYCKNFIENAATSRNFHALLLVICRHLEDYTQSVQMLIQRDENGAPTSSFLSVPTPGASTTASVTDLNFSALRKDHPWVTQLLYFLRVVIQYILSNLNYDETLIFFQHLAIPDIASKPGTPNPTRAATIHGRSSSAAAMTSFSNAAPSPTTGGGGMYSNESNWVRSPTTAVGGGRASPERVEPITPPVKNHLINLNPNSRRTSLNSQSDMLTRFVCAIVNMLEVLGDGPLNSTIASGKPLATVLPLTRTTSNSSASSSATSAPTPTNAAAASTKAHQPLIDLHLELLNTTFVLLSTQMYLPLSTEYEQVFLDRLLYTCKPPMLNSRVGFVTSLIWNVIEILPPDWESTLRKKQASLLGGPSPTPTSALAGAKSFFGRITSSITSTIKDILTFPVWAVRYLFTIPPNHPLMDRSILLLELLVYQSPDNDFRFSIRQLRNSDPWRPPVQTKSGPLATVPKPVKPDFEEENVGHTILENCELGLISFEKLYYALCATLLSEHINLFLYSLIHENIRFRNYLLQYHSHDLDYLIMPMLEIIYREIDISKHHVYMIINIWILLTQQPGFDEIIRTIRIKEVPFFKEMVLKDLQLTQVMQIVLLRTLQLNLRTKLKEPHIFNNCLAAFCNLTITALMGPMSICFAPAKAKSPASSPKTKAPSPSPQPSPSSKPPPSPMASPKNAQQFVLPPPASPPPILISPLTLHPQVAFRLTRVLCILSRKFMALQVQHEQLTVEHNALMNQLQLENRTEITEDEEKVEIDFEETGEELGTCVEFLQLLLEVVNHSIVHSLPPASSVATTDASYQSSLLSNPHLLYNLIQSQDYFFQLVPYAHLFESHLITNIANVIKYYVNAPGVNIPKGETGKFVTAGGRNGSFSKKSIVTEKEVESTVQALIKAIKGTPMKHYYGITSPIITPVMSPNPAAMAQSPGQYSPISSTNMSNSSPSRSSFIPPPSPSPSPHHRAQSLSVSGPEFDVSALVERGPFTYHEQENSQDFFVPYIYQMTQTMGILPRIYTHGEQASVSLAALGINESNHGAGSQMGEINADEVFMAELEDDSNARFRRRASSADMSSQYLAMRRQQLLEQELYGEALDLNQDSLQEEDDEDEDGPKLEIAIK